MSKQKLPSLYINNDIYKVLDCKDRQWWLKERNHGIGGSEASTCANLNPWQTSLDLWNLKTNRVEPEDISDKPCVRYGTLAEEHIRALFQLDNEDKYEVQYVDNVMFENVTNPFMRYSPDGCLVEKETGRKGILEIKTTTVYSYAQLVAKWGTKEEPQLPDNYFCQVLHGLNVTGFDFIELRALIRFSLDPNYQEFRTFHIEKEEVKEDMEYLKEKVTEFWTLVETDEQPPLTIQLPTI